MNTTKTKKAPASGSGGVQAISDMPIEGELEDRMGVSYADQAAAGGMQAMVNPMNAISGGMGGAGGGAGMGGGDGGNGQGGGTPQVRTCATMTVYRRLLNEDPAYALGRDHDTGGGARGVEYGGAEYLGCASGQPDRCAEPRLSSCECRRGQYARALFAVDGRCTRGIRAGDNRPAWC